MIRHFINQSDPRYIFLISDKGKYIKDKNKLLTEMELLERYLNKIPQFQFLPSYTGIPKAEVHLDSIMKDGRKIYYCFSGLYLEVLQFCEKNNIKTTITRDLFKRTHKHTYEEFCNIVSNWNLSLNPYQYQLESAYNILGYSQSLSELATRAGKTLIGYIIFRYSIEYLGVNNILMICPSITLVKQGFEDFNEYAEFFKTETIWSKGEFVSGSNLTISTFQSLVKYCDKKSNKYNPKFFDRFDCVLVDEVHNAKAASIKSILSQDFMKRVKLRFGFSGTLPLKKTLESFSVQELMGGMIQQISPKELIDNGFISRINIKQIRIHYPSYKTNSNIRDIYTKCGEYLCSNFEVDDSGKKILLDKENRSDCMIYNKKLPYTLKTLKKQSTSTSISYLEYILDLCKAKGSNLLTLENYISHFSQKKLNIIKNIVQENSDGNMILFFHYTEYCKNVHTILKNEFPDREVILMTGSTSAKNRSKYKQMLKDNDNIILCASYGVSSTGLTLRLKYGIFVESFKSHVIVKQSAGRGLCLDDNKDEFILYDLIDVLPDTMRISAQGSHKTKLYKQEGFPCQIINE